MYIKKYLYKKSLYVCICVLQTMLKGIDTSTGCKGYHHKGYHRKGYLWWCSPNSNVS